MAKVSEYALQIAIGGKIASSLNKAVGGSMKELSKMQKLAASVGKATAAGFAGTVTAVAAVTKELYNLGAEFDDAYDQIRIATGATGDQLQELQQSMNDVYASVPASMEDTATAIADYNTRLGLTGDTLETISTQALQASDMLGEDLSGMIEASSQAMQQWNISEKDMSENMDYMFKVSQATGGGMTELFGSMQKYGPQLQDLGYSFQDAAALVGQMEKAGVNTNEVLGAMKKSVGSLAKQGISAPAGFKMYSDQIKAAGSATEAAAIASEVFGARAGSTMAAAIRDGTLSVEEFTTALNANQETIGSAAFDTYDFPEQLEIMKHQLEVALQPAAADIFGALSDIMPSIGSLLSSVTPLITEATSALVPIIETIVNSIDFDEISNIISQILPIAVDLLNEISPMLSELLPLILPIASQLVGMLAPVLGEIVDLFPSISSAIGTVISLLPVLLPALQPIFDIIVDLLPLIGDVFDLITVLQPTLTFLAETVTSVLGAAFDAIMPIIDNVIGYWQGLIDFIKNVFQGNWAGAWQAAQDVVANVWGYIKSLIAGGINFFIKMLNAVIGAINKIHIGPLPDWKILGEYAGAEIGFHLNTIPEVAFAKGGIVTRPTTALIGEGSEPEGVFPLSKLEDFLDGKGEKAEVINFNFSPNVYYTGGGNDEIRDVFNEEFERFKMMIKQWERDRKRVAFS